MNHLDDLLTPANLQPMLQGTIFASGQNFHHFSTIDSTNSAAIQAAASGAEEGSVFVAEQQLAGRGRGGHAWHSAPSTGIYLSVILRPQLSPADVLWLSLVTGLAAHDAIQSVVGISPDLRWPNDIMLGDKKLGGILTELNAEMRRVNFAVVGIGINVNQPDFPAEIKSLATSLRIETDRDWPRVEIAAALLKSLDREYRALQENFSAGAIESIISRFEQRSSYARGAHVQVHESESQAGAENVGYTGRTLGLDARGFLKIQTEDGMRTLISGGIRKV
jgi:BirA family biotin operon repressor/biotin-[acetyl-CoA-carboxylase] ligase